MAIVHILDRVTEWTQEAICNQVQLKCPHSDQEDVNYNDYYRLVKPTAFALYVPTKDRLPPKVAAPIPSLCIQLVQGKDELIRSQGTMKLQFGFSAWDPGLHEKDLFFPVKGIGQAYQQWNSENAMEFYQRRGDGWRDVWNFVDAALRVLENTEFLAGYRVVKEAGIDYGPLAEQESIPDYYPFWFAWVSFTLEYVLTRKNETYQHLL